MPPPSEPLSFGPDSDLSCHDLERIAHHPDTPLQLTSSARERLEAARDALSTLRSERRPVYGITTGFGPLHEYETDPNKDHAGGLIDHLAAGSGNLLSPHVVRAMMAARVQSLAQGYSAITRPALQSVLDLLSENVIPAVPEIGSLGASGDLTPLAHVARVCTGRGRVRTNNGPTVPADHALADAGLDPVSFDDRDALAVVNGTAFMTGTAALALARANRLLHRAETLTGWIYRLLGCSREALAPTLHAVRGHEGQLASAETIRTEANRNGASPSENRPLQEVYSIRCAPQILGAVRDQLSYVRRMVVRELNGVTDNPVIDASDPKALHGGNFQGQQVGFSADAMNEAVTQVGVLAERQLDVLLSSDQNGGAPPLLAWEPGPTSGLAGAQLTATALVAELRKNATMTATSSIPTNNDNQDVVSMGALAARTAYKQTEHLAPILAVVGMALSQLTALRTDGPAEGAAPRPPAWMPDFEPVVNDRSLRDDIDRIANEWLKPNL